uniref:Uncharacterized protein n=1 Tax=Strongyloides stercoralis TaxID=6248 RepID=A0AAF5DLM1_STRER
VIRKSKFQLEFSKKFGSNQKPPCRVNGETKKRQEKGKGIRRKKGSEGGREKKERGKKEGVKGSTKKGKEKGNAKKKREKKARKRRGKGKKHVSEERKNPKGLLDSDFYPIN